MTAPRNLPLEAFDPRYEDLLLRGSRETFEIPCNSPNEAYRLQAILCAFRQRMRKEHGEAGASRWKPLFGCIVSHPRELDASSGKRKPLSHLVLRPRHSEFSSVLDSLLPARPTVSVDASGLPEDPLAAFEPEEKTS